MFTLEPFLGAQHKFVLDQTCVLRINVISLLDVMVGFTQALFYLFYFTFIRE